MAGAIIDSTSIHWNTPPKIFDPIEEFFEGVDLDPCSNSTSIVRTKHRYTLPQDGLILPWGPKFYRTYVNPPYGPGERVCAVGCEKKKCLERGYHCEVDIPGIGEWVWKMYHESQHNKADVIGLIPAAVETRWWQQVIFPKARGICWLDKRVKFLGAPSCCPRPLALVYFSVRPIQILRFRDFFGRRLGPCYDPLSVHQNYVGSGSQYGKVRLAA